MKTEVVEYALQRAREDGADEAEVYYSASHALRFGVQGQRVVDTKFSFSHGLGIRVQVGHKSASAYVEGTDLGHVRDAVAQAVTYARVAPLRETYDFTRKQPDNSGMGLDPGPFSSRPLAEKKQRAFRVEETARELAGGARITHAYYGEFRNEVVVGNTHGVLAGYGEERGEILLGMQIARGSDLVRAAGTAAARNPDLLDEASLARAVFHRAERRLGAVPVSPGRMSAILSPRAAAQFVRVFSPILFAESLPLSGLTGKLGTQLMSPVISFVDDPTLEFAGQRPFDDEGRQSARRNLVTNGHLVDLLYNNGAAARAERLTSGSAFRRSFKTRVITAASNMYIRPGVDSPEELISQAGEGIYIDELFGLEGTFHWEYPRFSIRALGHRIHQGEIGEALREFTFQGAFLPVMRAVKAVASDLTWDSAGNRQQFGAPTLLLEEAEIGA